jgi:hypothetical protein
MHGGVTEGERQKDRIEGKDHERYEETESDPTAHSVL